MKTVDKNESQETLFDFIAISCAVLFLVVFIAVVIELIASIEKLYIPA